MRRFQRTRKAALDPHGKSRNGGKTRRIAFPGIYFSDDAQCEPPAYALALARCRREHPAGEIKRVRHNADAIRLVKSFERRDRRRLGRSRLPRTRAARNHVLLRASGSSGTRLGFVGDLARLSARRLRRLRKRLSRNAAEL